ncbi:MAG: type I-U CRISPR-associated protein Csb2 [Bradymonadaceae bacterium]
MTSELFIELRFPAGRYHATPWDRQVNEGAVEWPPSPWRIMRALISVWHSKGTHICTEDTLRRIIAEMSESPPSWRLPRVTLGHTRHYMPTDKSTTKIFDTFLKLDPDALAVAHWPDARLDADDLLALDELLQTVTYLGRAESWASLKCIPAIPDFAPNAGPAQLFDHSHGRQGIEQLMPLSQEELDEWATAYRGEAVARDLRILQEKKPTATKLTPAAIRKIDDALPETPYDVLLAETSLIQKSGWSQPPGSRWVTYLTPQITHWVSPRGRPRMSLNHVTMARFAVASQVPPRLTTTIHQTQKLHQSLVKYSDNHPLFTGRDEDGKTLQGHEHAFIFAEANDGRTDRITHMVVWAPGGLGDEVQRQALDRVQRLWGKDGHDLQLVLLGVGDPADFAGFNVRAGQCPLVEEAATWRSLTPFVPTRHPKHRKNGEPKLDEHGRVIGGAEHDLLRLLSELGYPPVVSIEEIETATISERSVRWLEFDTERPRRQGRRGPRHGAGFQITFAEPVRGPILIGYGAHFGMGLFTPVSPLVNRSML